MLEAMVGNIPPRRKGRIYSTTVQPVKYFDAADRMGAGSWRPESVLSAPRLNMDPRYDSLIFAMEWGYNNIQKGPLGWFTIQFQDIRAFEADWPKIAYFDDQPMFYTGKQLITDDAWRVWYVPLRSMPFDENRIYTLEI